MMGPDHCTSQMRPDVQGFYEPVTGSIAYILTDPSSRRCVLIDPVLELDPLCGRIGTGQADRLLAEVAARGLEIDWIIDTHPHADHLSAAGYLQARTGAPTATGAEVVKVQKLWQAIYDLDDDLPTDGSQWDRLLDDGDRIQVGTLPVQALHCPGHTLASITLLAGDVAFIHDTLFMPDYGTARCDFPGGDADALWTSIERILALPGETRLFTGHDYRPNDRPAIWQSTVAEQKRTNVHLCRHPDRASFVTMRRERDKGLSLPRLMLLALQVNMAGGRLPPPSPNGRRFLRFPLDPALHG
ncbi:MBL fold metallo-hydrolase [Marinivivus vitaminiproducens]|uniref:MBL fold metallo-hydrolase n=1 Tax=Marinivivus vitaminiproducens TaxID=3035935 RepID=UPI0027A85CE4|nr:MBL fold metallo-hydrolase [Geminicoccaceae bacterium SCSIO 64248]